MSKGKQTAPVQVKKENAIVAFFKDTVAEMKKVTWLSRREIMYLTVLVLVIAVITGIVLGAIDFGFSQLVNKLIIGG
jgi:preprotein translocase subunit SecE